jgi:hypothetical protein
MAKRCKFCAHKLDSDGYCTNPKCPEYIRAEIEKKAASESSESTTGTSTADDTAKSSTSTTADTTATDTTK